MAEEQENIKINFDTNAAQAANDTNKLGNSISNITEEVEQTEQAYKSLKSQLREANQELVKSIQLYGETSQEAIKAAKGVADLKDQIGFAKDLSDNFNPDQKMKALGAATQIAATGMQGVTAGMALFGDQSKDTEKMLLKVQAAMAFSDAISGLSNLGDQWKNLKAVIAASSIQQKVFAAGTVVAATVQKAFTGSVTETSVGFKVLRGAIIATGIGALAVGIGMLVANFDKVKKVVLNLIPGLASAGDAIMNIVNAVTDFIGATSEAERALDKQKAQAEKSLAQNEKYLKRNESTLSDSQKRELELRNAHFQRVKDGEFSAAESLQMYREAKAKDARLAQEKADKEAEDARKKANDKAKADRDKTASEEKDKREKLAAEKLAAEMKSAQDAIDIVNKLKENTETPAQKEEREYQEKLAILEANNVNTEELTRQHLITLANIDKEEKDKKAKDEADNEAKRVAKEKEVSDLRLANKKAEQDALNALGNNALNAAKDLFGKNKTVQKGIIVAEGGAALGKLAVNTVEQVSKDNTASPLTFGMPWSGVHIATGALGAASIIANTTKALSALGGGGSISAPSGMPTQRSAAPPTVAFNNSAENQIGQSLARVQADQPPLKVNVLESDITKAQSNVKVLETKNVFP